MSKTFTTTVRFNLDRDEDRVALEWLRSLDKSQYRSYSQAIIAALNDYFSRRVRLAADPYLETREKEDAFLLRVQQAVERGLASVSVMGQVLSGALCAPPVVQAAVTPPDQAQDSPDDETEDMEAALDFADGF